MSRPFDATMRGLIELEPAAWLRFLDVAVIDPAKVRVIDSNISTVSAEADKVLWIDAAEPWVEHVELQAGRDVDLAERVHWYSTIMRRGLKVPVHSTIVLLRPAADGAELTGIVEHRDRLENVYSWFHYGIVRIWERNVEEILAAGLPVLPLAPVSNVQLERLPEVLVAISDRMKQEASPDQAAMLWNATRVLMGLRFPQAQVDAIIRGVSAMLFGINGIEESSVYQGILQKGRMEGRTEGRMEGRMEGRTEGRMEGKVEGRVEATRANLLRICRRKFGDPGDWAEAEVLAIDDLDRLHELIDRALEVGTWDELLKPASLEEPR